MLTTLARLIAPFTPFVAEMLHRHLVRSQDAAAEPSVHLDDWPQPTAGRVDVGLETGMAAIQRIVRLGHAARNEHGLKTRQPLAAVTLVTSDPALPEVIAPQVDLLLDELNVKAVHWAADRALYVHQEVRPIFPKTGPRFGKRMAEVKKALAEADGDALAAELERAGRVTIALADGPVDLAADEVEVRLIERPGMATQGDRELLVALDTALDQKLVDEGWAREVIHHLQTARKDAGLDYADRIRVRFDAAPALAAAIAAHRETIQRETLAVALEPQPSAADLASHPVEGMAFGFTIQRA